MALFSKTLGWLFSLTLLSLIWSFLLRVNYVWVLVLLLGLNILGYIIRVKLK